MGRRNGDDVSALEAELKEKFAKLNEVGWEVDSLLNTQYICTLFSRLFYQVYFSDEHD